MCHAFVPGNISEQTEKVIKVGSIYLIYNFSVKEYKPDEKFRCIHNDQQITFTNFTKIEIIEKDDKLIPEHMFDFYDLGDLKEVADRNIYLTGMSQSRRIFLMIFSMFLCLFINNLQLNFI